jgi:hypothetical protein
MGSPAPASPPTLDTAKSKELTAAELAIKRKEISPTTAAAGEASRSEAGKNMAFALRGFTNPASVIYGDQIQASNKTRAGLQKQLAELSKFQTRGTAGSKEYYDGSSWINQKQFTDRRRAITGKIANQTKTIQSLQRRNPVAELTKAFAPEFAARDRLLGDMQGARKSSAEYTRLQGNLAEGGELGRRLMTEALGRSERGFGQLSAEAERNATQAARSGMAARGMATGSAGLGAELLSRDTYQRQRAAEDINFVGGVMSDERARFGASAQLSQAEQARKLALGQDAYNFRLSTNPKLMLSGLGSPYANMTSNAMQMVSGAQFSPQYSGGQFSGGGGSGLGQTLGTVAGGIVGGVAGAYLGAGVGAVPGAAAGASLGGAAGSYLSDKREKTDIKPLGKVTSLLDLPAYEYRYKGEKKKRKGVMAQDVQKVLPEAVTEVDYQGKRRLAIKPGVIGAALAEELTNQTKAVAA